MKTIGLLGGMSWESTTDYYKAINRGIKETVGQLHSAKIILNSVDFAPIEKLQHQGDWHTLASQLSEAALAIEAAGADFLLICTNTMHKVAPEIERKINIPLLHIADATAETLLAAKVLKVGLLGTAFTMEEDFYKGRLTDKFDIEVLTPCKTDRKIVHDVIYQELCLGEVKESSKQQYLRIINDLFEQGAEGIILGCTEIGMLVKQQDTRIKIFDTTEIHAAKAVQQATLG
jgi:aspartate racemase